MTATTPFEPFTLETPRLLLRWLRDADAPAVFAMFSDPAVMRYWSTPPMTVIGQAEDSIRQALASCEEGSSLRLGIERRDDALLIGTCTVFNLHVASRRGEIGYALRRDAWGQGTMHEALVAFFDHLFGPMRLHRLEADIDPRNTASARVLERLGFEREGYLRERWIVDGEISDSAVYGLLEGRWRERKRGPVVTE